MSKDNKILGIYLAFYEDYGIDGLERFSKFLVNLDGAVNLVVVCNGTVLNILQGLTEHVIVGDNTLREFSGWDIGIKYAQAKGLYSNECVIVFANDTFCKHNNFGLISRWAFSRSFRGLMKNSFEPVLAGEVWPFGGTFSVDGYSADRWVSTYLFAMSSAALASIKGLSPRLPMQRFYSDDDQIISFSELVSPNLARHLHRWLRGSGRTGWKNQSGVGVIGPLQLRGKASSIICEKHLSAKVNSSGGVIIDVFQSDFVRMLRRVESVFSRL